jgi:sulfur carrier protein
MNIQIVCNGERREIEAGIAVGDLVKQLGVTAKKFAVEVNRKVVARDRLDAVMLAEGDEVNIVTLVGGG